MLKRKLLQKLQHLQLQSLKEEKLLQPSQMILMMKRVRRRVIKERKVVLMGSHLCLEKQL
jgi:hypothetical protein